MVDNSPVVKANRLKLWDFANKFNAFFHLLQLICEYMKHDSFCQLIADFLCHSNIKTMQQIKSTIKEVKEGEYSNSLAKIQVCAMFRVEDIRRNVLLKFRRLCMETSWLHPPEAHKYGYKTFKQTTGTMIPLVYVGSIVI